MKVFFLILILFLSTLEIVTGIFPKATELSDTELQRCITACQSTKSGKLVEKAGKYWENLDVVTFGGNTGTHEKVLNRQYSDYGIFKAEGPRVVIAFPGTDFLQCSDVFSDVYAEDYNIQSNKDNRFKHQRLGGTSSDATPGRCHKGFLGVYKSTSGEIRHLLDSYWKSAGFESPQALQITVTGHSLGGAVAQLAGVDIVNHLYFDNGFDNSLFNKGNNVTVVTFGSPPVFNSTAQKYWDKNWGRENHLRVFRENDFVPTIYSDLIGWRTITNWVWKKVVFGIPIPFRQVKTTSENYKVYHTGTARSFPSGGRIAIATHTLDGYAADFKKWVNSAVSISK